MSESTTNLARPARPARPQAILTVLHREWLSPHTVRITAEARDMLGGNGILLDYQVMRHMVDVEAIHTFEGTETMQTLIVGRAITGLGAFT